MPETPELNANEGPSGDSSSPSALGIGRRPLLLVFLAMGGLFAMTSVTAGWYRTTQLARAEKFYTRGTQFSTENKAREAIEAYQNALAIDRNNPRDLLSRHPGILHLPARLELTSLVTSGVPIDLPDGKQLRIGSLRPQSPCIGRPIRACVLNSATGESEIVLALRGNQVLLTGADAPLEAGDRLLVATSARAWDSICERDLDPLQ
jgi:hypothetical protein